MRPLIVGQAPSRGTDGLRAFDGKHSGRRLARLMGMGQDEMLAAFDTVNLFKRWPGKSGKGDRFPARDAKRRAAAVGVAGRSLVVFAGVAVAKAFGREDLTPVGYDVEWDGPP